MNVGYYENRHYLFFKHLYNADETCTTIILKQENARNRIVVTWIMYRVLV